MKIGKQAKRDAKQLFQSCCVDGRLNDDRVRRAVRTVLTQKPRSYLAILSHFQRLVRLDVESRTARVESATALESSQQTAIQSSLNRRYGPDLNISFAQNPHLIGGLRVKVGSDVYDGSIQSRLAGLAASF
jgi:F-type H+-transporting ATPase subunit delta